MKPTLVRTAVLSGTTLLALGIAGPALACIDTAASGAVRPGPLLGRPTRATPTLTLAEYQAKVDARLAKTLARLADAKTRIADSTKLTDAEKSAKTARIDDLVATIEALRAQVAADTSIDAIKADMKAAFAPDVDDVKASLDARLGRLDREDRRVAGQDRGRRLARPGEEGRQARQAPGLGGQARRAACRDRRGDDARRGEGRPQGGQPPGSRARRRARLRPPPRARRREQRRSAQGRTQARPLLRPPLGQRQQPYRGRVLQVR